MARVEKMSAAIMGILSFAVAGQFVYSPVFADGPVDIEIIEKADDGTGNYKDWEDIAGAMPGMRYSVIPQVRNNGAIAVPVTMCLTESGMDAGGSMVELDAGTFQIDINDAYWTKISGEDNDGAVASPITACYKYNLELATNGITEPLFSEIYLSEQLGNEHKNATFALHLDAYATDGIPPEPVEPDEPEGPVVPGEPNTGKFTNSEPLTVGGYVALSTGLAALIGMMIYLAIKVVRRK